MGRKKEKAKSFVMVYRALLKDPTFQGLSNSAKVLYIYLRAKFNRKTYSEVSLAYSEVKFMSSKTVSRCFKELQEKGFIKKIKHGGLYGGVTTYKFTGEFKHFYYEGLKI